MKPCPECKEAVELSEAILAAFEEHHVAETKELESCIKELEAELKEHDDYYRKVVNDECAGDEVHCTCVPALRDKIGQLENET